MVSQGGENGGNRGASGAGSARNGGKNSSGPGKVGRPAGQKGPGKAGRPERSFTPSENRSGAAKPQAKAQRQDSAPRRSNSPSLPPGARGRALWLLNAVLIQGRTLASARAEAAAGLEPSDEARAFRLASDTLRQMSRADRLLSPFLRLKPTEPVMNLLRLATVELARGGAAHGVVHAAVNLARAIPETVAAAGLVNAVLRRVSENLVPLDQLPVPSLPKSLRKRLIEAWGKPAVEAMEALFAQSPPVDLTAKDGNGAALAERLGGQLLPGGSLRLGEARQISALPGYETGDFWVQDAAAALPAQVLAPLPGEVILDLCAAPGGKTLQLAAKGAKVTALDLSAERMARVAENLKRTGLAAELIVADALSWQPGAEAPRPDAAKAAAAEIAGSDAEGLFDAILLDAPCSATGTIRRHPDLPHLRAEADLAPLLELQAKLIDRAFTLLKPGGRLVYCTCSLLPEEGEAQTKAALARLPGLRADPAAVAFAEGVDPAFLAGPGELRLRPDHWAEIGGIDGFYIAAFRKAEPDAEAEAEGAETRSRPAKATGADWPALEKEDVELAAAQREESF